MPHWPPFEGSLSSVSGDSCNQSIYGTPYALIGTSCTGSCTAPSQLDIPGKICGRTKWYDDQRYMDAYKPTRTLRGVDIEGAMMGFNIENLTAKQALLEAKDQHTRRWQTKEGTYRLKEKLLPDVRDTDVEMADISTGP